MGLTIPAGYLTVLWVFGGVLIVKYKPVFASPVVNPSKYTGVMIARDDMALLYEIRAQLIRLRVDGRLPPPFNGSDWQPKKEPNNAWILHEALLSLLRETKMMEKALLPPTPSNEGGSKL
ncbi:MAG: hypothetical protein QXI37_03270 [Thermoprotei archaeon]